MLLKKKVMLISREVIERARQRDEQTEVWTEVRTPYYRPQYVLPLTMALLTFYTVNARYAEPASLRELLKIVSTSKRSESILQELPSYSLANYKNKL